MPMVITLANKMFFRGVSGISAGALVYGEKLYDFDIPLPQSHEPKVVVEVIVHLSTFLAVGRGIVERKG
jgi:hypothetical protein